MSILNLSDNITLLRKERKITQEALADFLGVTKASVSKWETDQCLPDILFLPRLAAFFNVSIDELIGYNPQLSPEQIQKKYLDFTSAFAKEPFDIVIARVRETIKGYYSCYPLLLQMCVLFLNHAQLAGSIPEMQAILSEARELCEHIIAECDNVSVSSDAIALKAVLDLQLGDVNEVISSLEPISDPTRFSGQNDTLLIQAYRMAGKNEKAMNFIQVSIYLHLLSLITISTQYLAANADSRESCYETIKRIDAVADAYRLDKLHPNTMAQFNYQAALNCLGFMDEDATVLHLNQYAENIVSLLEPDGCKLHGDEYFNRLAGFIDSLALGSNPPRNQTFIKQSVLASLENPAFKALSSNAEFMNIVNKFNK